MSMTKYDAVIIGAGCTGFTAAYVLGKHGEKVRVIEADTVPGGLAVLPFADGLRVLKFYHHWLNNDVYVLELIKELGMNGDAALLPTRTGMYFNARMWKLSTPLDLLYFYVLSLVDRARLGLLVLQVRRIKDWKAIAHLSIREWLKPLCGKSVYGVVWEPLIASKFSVRTRVSGVATRGKRVTALHSADPAWLAQLRRMKYLGNVCLMLRLNHSLFETYWIKVWRSEYAQLVTERNYSPFVPSRETPYENARITTMEQIYPKDCGTNYAIREAREIAELIENQLQAHEWPKERSA